MEAFSWSLVYQTKNKEATLDYVNCAQTNKDLMNFKLLEITKDEFFW